MEWPPCQAIRRSPPSQGLFMKTSESGLIARFLSVKIHIFFGIKTPRKTNGPAILPHFHEQALGLELMELDIALSFQGTALGELLESNPWRRCLDKARVRLLQGHLRSCHKGDQVL